MHLLVAIGRSETPPGIGPLDPTCWYLEDPNGPDGIDWMNRFIGVPSYALFNDPGFFVSAVPHFKFVNTIWGIDSGNYPIFCGTHSPIGPEWLYNEPYNGSTSYCFPYRWNQYLNMKQSVESDLPNNAIIFAEIFSSAYDQLIGGPLDYGSPHYPMGPWTSSWVYFNGYYIR